MASPILIGSLKRLYKTNKEANWTANDVTTERLQSMVPKPISQEEYEQILAYAEQG